MKCGNGNSINKTFIIEPLSLTGGSPTLSACTTMYTNLVKSCSGETAIYLTDDIVVISGDTSILGNITATTINATSYFSGGTNIIDIINENDTYITGFTYDNNNNLTITRNDSQPYTINLSVMSALTINGDLTVIGDTILNNVTANTVTASFFSGDSISINGGEIMTKIPDSLDFQLFGNQSSTGIIEFSGLSINTFDNSNFDLGVTKGWIVNNTTNPSQPSVKYVDYTGSTGSNPSGITLNYLATNPVTYIGLSGDSIYDIVQSNKPFIQSERRDLLELGVVVHTNNTNVSVINNYPTVVINPTQQLYDLIDGLGFFSIGEDSNTYKCNGNNLNIDKSGGDIFANGSNYEVDNKNPHVKTLLSGSSITFRYRTQDSVEFSGTTTIETINYDLNGVITPVPTNKFTIQRIAVFTSNQTRIQYGQNIYDSIDDAEASLSTEVFVTEKNISENALLRSFLIVKEGTTDLSNPRLAKFIKASLLGDANDTVVGNVHRTEIVNSSSTGLRDGGVISADSPTTFKIAAGSGVVVDNVTNSINPSFTDVIWEDITGNTLTSLTGDVVTFVGIDALGNINQFPLSTPPTQLDKRLVILLGAIAHSNKVSITNIYNAPTHIVSPVNQHEDLTSSIGTFSVNGNFVEPISGTLELTKGIGNSYFYGGNFQIDESNPSVIETGIISGSTTPFNPLVYATGTDVLGLSGYSIDSTNYDPNGDGILTTINNNKFVPHRIWHLPINNLLVFQYGQTQYNSLNLAIDGFSTENFIEPPGLSIGAYLISVVITKKGETDLSDISTTKFIQQGKFAGTGGGGGSIADTLQTAYNNSIQPEIITDAIGGSVDFRIGSGSDSDNLITTQNSSGNTTSWINGLGEATFSTVSGNTFFGDGSNLTGIIDTYVTGQTFNNSNYELSTVLNDGTTFISNLSILSSDMVVTGGTYDINTGVVEFTNNSGGTFNVSGFSSGMTDSYTTTATTVGTAIQFTNNLNGINFYNVDLTPIISGKTDVVLFDSHTGDTNNPHNVTIEQLSGVSTSFFNTYTGDTATELLGKVEDATNVGTGAHIFRDKTGTTLNFRTLSGGTNTTVTTVGDVNVIDVTIPADVNTFITGFTYDDANTFTITRNDLSAFTATIDEMTGLTVTGSLSAVTVSADTFYGDGSNLSGVSADNFYTTGVTLIDNVVYFDRNDSLSAYTLSLTSVTTEDIYVTGATFSLDTLTLTRNDDVDIVVSGFSSGSDIYTTGSTLVGNVLYFDRNDSLSAYTVDLSTLVTSGGTSSGGTDTIKITGSRNKSNQNNIFLRHNDGTPYNLIPYRVYTDSTITNVVASGRDLDTWQAHILTGTTVSTDSIYNLLLSGVDNQYDDSININISSGDTLYLYMSGTSVSYPTMDIYIKKR